MFCAEGYGVPTVRYVKEGASGTGMSWEDASGNLQEMISASVVGDEVYVAAGRYYAREQGALLVDERGTVEMRAFVMKAGVSVYGGFNALAPEARPEERKWVTGNRYRWQLAERTVLCGGVRDGVADGWQLDSLGWCWQPAGYMDNAEHVVWFASEGFEALEQGEDIRRARPLRAETVLDGFTIEGGNAGGTVDGSVGWSAGFGGGVYLVENGVVQNCVIRENYAVSGGGGVFFNGGGRISDCFIMRNAASGSAGGSGKGGGVYVSGKGLLERSFVVNNTASKGGGVYLAPNGNALPYEAVAEMSVIANNTATSEGGGVYADSAGVLTASLVAANNCQDAGFSGNGRTGGIFVNSWIVVTGSVLYGNTAVSNTRQGYYQNIISGDEVSGNPASVQIVCSAVDELSAEMFGDAGLTDVVDIGKNGGLDGSGFLRPAVTSGILPTVMTPVEYIGQVDWNKESCSVLLLRGATGAEAPYLSRAEGKQVNIPLVTIDHRVIERRPDIGPYLSDLPEVKGAWDWNNSSGYRLRVYVDNSSRVCGDGSSWASPTHLIGPAIEYVARHYKENGGSGYGEVWVKEGVYKPVYSAEGGKPRSFHVDMKGGVVVYGGFPASVDVPDMGQRDPVAYRTVLDGDIGVSGGNEDNSWHVVVFEPDIDTESVLDGFTIRNVNASSEAGAVVVYSDKAVIRNCMIENCRATDGAAIWGNVDFVVENCVVNNNSSPLGAAVKVTEGTELKALTVVLNEGNGVSGGKLVNSIVWGNTGVQLDNVQTVNYSAIGGSLVTGEGNVQVDFTLDDVAVNFTNSTKVAGPVSSGFATVHGGEAVFEPMCMSPFVNVGSDVGLEQDIRGTVRKRGGISDIGAFEATCVPDGGDIRFVREGGSGDGRSWATASGDLRAMVDEMAQVVSDRWYQGNHGHTQVWVAAGTYKGGFTMKAGVEVYGGFPSHGFPSMDDRRSLPEVEGYRTVLSGEGKQRVLTCAGGKYNAMLTEAVWDGFTIRDGRVSISMETNYGGEALGGGGVLLWEKGVLRNCVIRENVNEVSDTRTLYVRGGGVMCEGGSLVNCRITENRVVGTVTSGFVGGECWVYGGGLYMTSGEVYNCLVENNSVTALASGVFAGSTYVHGAGVYAGNGSFFNNTVVANKAFSSTGWLGSSASGIRIEGDTRIMNCIVWGNEGTELQITRGSSGTASVSYSCIGADGRANNGFSGTGNIGAGLSANQIFAGFAGGDYRLVAVSPCINMGNTYPDGIDLPETDIDYTDRIKDCAVDMGAYEFGMADGGVIVPQIKGDTAIVYVTRYGRGSADGSSWEQAVCQTKLQRAIDMLSLRGEAVRQVWVASGYDKNTEEWLPGATFYPTLQLDAEDERSRSFRMRAGVQVIGGFQGNEDKPEDRVLWPEPVVTIFSGDIKGTPDDPEDDAYHVVVFDSLAEGQTAYLEQMVILDGNAGHFENPLYRNGGGILLRSGGHVANCHIRRCYAAAKGGGVYMEDMPSDRKGYGAMLTGSAVQTCRAAEGGGVYAGQWGYLMSNTIVYNKASKGGGLSFSWPATVTATVIWGNTADNGKDLAGITSTPFEPQLEDIYIPLKAWPVNYSAVEQWKVEGYYNIALTSENSGAARSPDFTYTTDATLLNGGLMPKESSALIDAGIDNRNFNNASAERLLKRFHLTLRDMAGNKRFHTYHADEERLVMDIGAYEFPGKIELKPDINNRLYVARTPRGRMDGSSWKDASANLQDALNYFRDKAGKGEVWLQGGYTYVPRVRMDGDADMRAVAFVLNDRVSLYGGFMGDTVNDVAMGRVSESELGQRPRFDRNGNGVYEEWEFRYETVLDGAINPSDGYDNNAYHVLYYEGTEEVVIDGLTIRNGQAVNGVEKHSRGGGLYARGPVNVRNCIFTDNYAFSAGGALYAEHGGKVWACLFGGNGVGLNPEKGGEGGALWMKGGVIAGSVVMNNRSQGTAGGGAWLSGTEVVNCVFVRNKNDLSGAGLYLAEGARLLNTVVWGNASGIDVTEIAGSGYAVSSALPAGRTGEGITLEGCVSLSDENMSSDGPQFIRPTAASLASAYSWSADWRVRRTSLLTDAGKRKWWNERGLPVTLHYEGKDGQVPLNRISGEEIDIGAYENIFFELADRDTLYVRTWENPKVIADGSSWDRATSDLQGAIRKLESRSGEHRQIWVAQGIYYPSQKRVDGDMASRSFVIRKGGFSIYGGFPDDGVGATQPDMKDRRPVDYPTLFDGTTAQARHVVHVEQTEGKTRLDGLTVKGGMATAEAGEATGAGIYAGSGAGNLFINHCIITGNSAPAEGSAVYAADEVGISNSLVFRNNAAGIIVGGKLSSVNNTVVVNTGDGVLVGRPDYNADAVVQNTVVWGNGRKQLFSYFPLTIHHSAVQDSLWEGNANLRLSAENAGEGGPHFRYPESAEISGFRPDCGSALTDAGCGDYPEGFAVDDYDLSGQTRVLFTGIDIGAFESVRGKAPEAPQVETAQVELCQGDKTEIAVENAVEGTRLFALHHQWEMVLNDKLVVSGDKSGTHLYRIVRADTTGCQSDADSLWVTVKEAEMPSEVKAPAEVCHGEDVVISFTPAPGYTYVLYEGVSERERFDAAQGSVTRYRPDVGEYRFRLQGKRGECWSGMSEEIVVKVNPSGGSDGSLIELTNPEAVIPGICEGDEITPLVYRYEGTSGITVTDLPAGLEAVLNATERTLTLSGRPKASGTYTLRAVGDAGTCVSARIQGVILLSPLPRFELGE